MRKKGKSFNDKEKKFIDYIINHQLELQKQEFIEDLKKLPDSKESFRLLEKWEEKK